MRVGINEALLKTGIVISILNPGGGKDIRLSRFRVWLVLQGHI